MRILIIDDDVGITNLVHHILSAEGYEVLSAPNGEKGIDIIREKSPDLVILDLMLPIQDGWDVCKNIRSFSNVPILIMSALNGALYIASALDAGADDYLVKPVPNNMLLARVKRLLQRSVQNQAHLPLYQEASFWATG